MKKETSKKKTLLTQYETFFRSSPELKVVEDHSLEQPSTLKIVPSNATSGAYEEPVRTEEN